MPVPVRIQKLVWGIFAGRCAMCRKILVHEETGGKSSLIGEIAHIIGEKESAARGAEFIEGDKDDPDNLMLVCREDHKIIDDNEAAYPPERLRKIRADYLKWLGGQLTPAQRWNLRISQYAYLNVPRLDEFAALAGYEVYRQPIDQAAPLSALGFDLNDLMSAYRRTLENIAINAIPVAEVSFAHEKYVGQLISFDRMRFRTKNLPALRPKRGDTNFTGNPAVDPHIYHAFPTWRLIINVDPQWITTSTAYGLFRPSSGASILSGFARVNGVDYERSSMTATALAIGLPPSFLDQMSDDGGREIEINCKEQYDEKDLSRFEDPITKSRRGIWHGTVDSCDFCGKLFKIGDYMVDGPVKRGGPWGNICARCFLGGDRRLGIGYGQLFHRQPERWVLVGGYPEPTDDHDY